MQSLLIVKKSSTAENDIRGETIEILDNDKKKEILQKLGIKSINTENYRFFDEEKICKDNAFYKKYITAIFEVYFPSNYDTVSRKNIYYPKEQIIQKENICVYVYKWKDVEISDSAESIHYLGEHTDKDEGQRVLIITSK